jgi:1-acyl-sn-glycerol-3-phosphate acyltransferase
VVWRLHPLEPIAMAHSSAASAFGGISSPLPVTSSFMRTGTAATAPSVPSPSPFESIPRANDGKVFVNKTVYDKHSPLYWLRMFIQASILLPIRIGITIVLLILIVMVAYAGTAGMSKLDLEMPMPLWRRILLFPLRIIVRVELAILSFWWVETKGTLAPRSRAPIIVSNHVGFVEPMLLMAVTGASPLTAAENNNIPFISPIFVALQSIWVEREKVATKGSSSGPTSTAAPQLAISSPGLAPAATAAAGGAGALVNGVTPMNTHGEGILGPGGATPAALIPDDDAPVAGGATAVSVASPTPFLKREAKTATGEPSGTAFDPSRQLTAKEIAALDINQKLAYRAKDNDYPHLLIFPEGTTTNTDALLSFKAGAFRPFAPIQPVAVKYPNRYYDPSWVSEGKGLYGIILSLLTQLFSRVQVHYLPPVDPLQSEIDAGPGEGAQRFADRVQRIMARALNGTATGFSYEDIMLSLVAVASKHPIRPTKERHYPVPLSVIEFNALRPAVKPDVLALRRYLKRFIALDGVQRKGVLDFDQFVKFFTTPGMTLSSSASSSSPSAIDRSISSSSVSVAIGGADVAASSSSFVTEVQRRLFASVAIKLGTASPSSPTDGNSSSSNNNNSTTTGHTAITVSGIGSPSSPSAPLSLSRESSSGSASNTTHVAAVGASFRQLAILLTVLEERGQQGFIDAVRAIFLSLSSSSLPAADGLNKGRSSSTGSHGGEDAAFVSRKDFEAFCAVMSPVVASMVASVNASAPTSACWTYAAATNGDESEGTLHWPAFASWAQTNFSNLSTPPAFPAAPLNPFIVAFKKVFLGYSRWEDHVGPKDEWTHKRK